MPIIIKSILWTILGTILIQLRFTPPFLPRLLGKSLYWIGVPLQIFVLGYQSDFSSIIWLPSTVTIIVLLLGWGLALLCWQKQKYFFNHSQELKTRQEVFEYQIIESSGKFVQEREKKSSWITDLLPQFLSQYRSRQASFILASMLGNTGFIGLAVVPTLIDRTYWSWIALYGLTHNILGSYGLGAIIASHFSSSDHKKHWWISLRNLFAVPALWAFVIGCLVRDLQFPSMIEKGLHISVLLVVPSAFLLIGMQLSQLQNIQNVRSAITPTILKMIVLPGLTGLACTWLGIQGDARLVLTIMSGMPAAFANAILAEEYNLDRQMAAGSIFLSTITLPLTIALWLTIF